MKTPAGLRQTSCSERASLTEDDRLAETQAIPLCSAGVHDAAQKNNKGETAQQIIGGFLMHLGEAPWEAEELMAWLDRGGFHITLKS